MLADKNNAGKIVAITGIRDVLLKPLDTLRHRAMMRFALLTEKL